MARYIGVLLAGLAATIARCFLRNPRLLPLTGPLWNRLSRITRRFAAHMTRLAAGHHPRASRARSRPGRGHTPAIRFPNEPYWLIHELKHEAAVYRSKLQHLLSQPGVADLLAAVPVASRALNPVRRALGLPLDKSRPAPPAPAPTPDAAPEPARTEPPPASVLDPALFADLGPDQPHRWPYNRLNPPPADFQPA